MLQIEQKVVNNKFSNWFFMLSWPFVAFYDLAWLWVNYCGLVWPFLWSFMVKYQFDWTYSLYVIDQSSLTNIYWQIVIFCVKVWSWVALQFVVLWPYIVFSRGHDPNAFGLLIEQSVFVVQCVKANSLPPCHFWEKIPYSQISTRTLKDDIFMMIEVLKTTLSLI